MKLFRTKDAGASVDPSSARLDRRSVVVGAGVTGVAALAAASLQRAGVEAPPVATSKPAPAAGAGYRESQHVLRYYETTRS